MSTAAAESFNRDPARYLENTVREYVNNSPENRLPAYDNDPIVEEPLVGFAGGSDPIFQEFKKDTVIGPFHLAPEEALPVYLGRQGKKVAGQSFPSLSVVSIVFTATDKTRLSNRPESVMASPRWQYTFGRGITFMESVLQHLVSVLEGFGYRAVAPICTKPVVFLWQIPDGPTSDWSEKHVAYAAGLGTFGLNSGLLTARGNALQCGSVITDLAIEPTPRKYDGFKSNCLYYRNGSCGRCVRRCPSGAISEKGYDSRRCFFYHEMELPEISRKMGREPEKGEHPAVCSLCMTKVPCERGIPPEPAKKSL